MRLRRTGDCWGSMQDRCSHCGGSWIEGKPVVETGFTDYGDGMARVRIQRKHCERCGIAETRKQYRPVSPCDTWRWHEVHIMETYDAG